MRPELARSLLIPGLMLMLMLPVQSLAQSAAQNPVQTGRQTGAIAPDPAAVAAQPLTVLRQRAAAGQATAQYDLGLRLQRGTGVLLNFTEASQWFARAAAQGHPAAQSRLGQAYHSGLGVRRDPDQALYWMQQAARSEAPEPLFDLARLLEQRATGAEDGAEGGAEDLLRAAQLYERAAAQGHVDAAVSLGVLYQNGTGVTQDLARARQLYEGPAAAGHARALNNLGLIYVRGDGLAQDYGRAAQLFQAAADQGLAVALNNLGTLYENGFGVALDEALAQQLYRQAADLGRSAGGRAITAWHAGGLFDARLRPPDTSAAGLQVLENGARAGDPVAQFLLGWVLLNAVSQAEDGVDRASINQASMDRARSQQVLALMQASAHAGIPAAMGNLALFYVEGRQLPQDYVLAYMWLLLASSAGQPEAADLAASLASMMTSAQVLDAQKRAQELAQVLVAGN